MSVPLKKLSVVIPVYNEENTVTLLLDKVIHAVVSTSLEIIIVNDGSTDSTPGKIEEWIRNHRNSSAEILYFSKPNGGKGSAVKAGIRRSSGDVVIIQDADLEYDPNDYEKCIRPILDGTCKVVYGSREAENRNRFYSAPSFYFGGLLLTFWINLLYHSNLTDEPTCYKTFDGPLIRSIPIDGDKFEWEPEITAKLLRLGFDILEIPVTYSPRKTTEGKKIKWIDGLQGLWTAFRWRFASLSSVRNGMCSVSGSFASVLSAKRRNTILLWTFVLTAFLLRFASAYPGFSSPEHLMREESRAFLAAADQIRNKGDFRARYPSCIATFPSGTPAYKITSLDSVRVPLYPAWLALLGGSKNLTLCILLGCLLGSLICIPVYFSGRLFGSDWIGHLAAFLFAVNPTAIALSPMFLPDTLFALIVALQGYFFLRFIKSAFGMNLVCAILLAGIAALIRPANALWIVPCILVILFFHRLAAHLKFNYVVISLLLFGAVLFPWVLGNHWNEIGWRMDSVSSEVLMKNASALEAEQSGQKVSAVILKHRSAEREFYASDPERYRSMEEQLKHRDGKMWRIIGEHPFRYFSLHFGIPTLSRIITPDFGMLLSNIGIGRNIDPGALSAKIISGTIYTLTALLYMACTLGLGWFLLGSLDRKHWIQILLLFLLSGYYLFMPGPIAIPRYLLPALPFLCVASAYGLVLFVRIIVRKKEMPRGLSAF